MKRVYYNLSRGWPNRWSLTRIKWYLCQLLPLTYRSRYKHNQTRRFAVWQMWFGYVFNYDDVAIDSDPN
jgi:hypothetical protein